MVDVRHERSNFRLTLTNLLSPLLTGSLLQKILFGPLPVAGLQTPFRLTPPPRSNSNSFSILSF